MNTRSIDLFLLETKPVALNWLWIKIQIKSVHIKMHATSACAVLQSQRVNRFETLKFGAFLLILVSTVLHEGFTVVINGADLQSMPVLPSLINLVLELLAMWRNTM